MKSFKWTIYNNVRIILNGTILISKKIFDNDPPLVKFDQHCFLQFISICVPFERFHQTESKYLYTVFFMIRKRDRDRPVHEINTQL
jgi:hypothetical protein